MKIYFLYSTYAAGKCASLLSAMLLFFLSAGFAQNRDTLNNVSPYIINQYTVLPDANYSIDKVATDASLPFKQDSLRAPVANYYWGKLSIFNPYPNNEAYRLSLATRGLNFTFYQYNPASKKWEGSAGGLNAKDKRRRLGAIACLLQKHAENIFYIKIALTDEKPFGYVAKPEIKLEKEVAFAADELFIKLCYLACCIVIISFAGYNLYVYFQLHDKTYLYYVIVQFGALIFFTADKFFFNVLLPIRVYNVNVTSDQKLYFFDVNNFLLHVAVIVIFCGFIQFTRAYLHTKQTMPLYDKVLRGLSYTYFFLEAIPISITISGIYFINIVPAANVFIIIIAVACLVTGTVAYRKKVPAASHFLAAHFLPVLFVAGSSTFILMYGRGSTLLPEIAILSQIFTFAVALVARVKLINEDLKAKAILAIQLKADVTVAEYKRLLAEGENKNITLTMELEREKNEQLQQRLEANQRELVGNSLYIHQKNKVLADLTTQMQDMQAMNPSVSNEVIKNIHASLKGAQHVDDGWDKFKIHFEQVRPSFFDNLQTAYPTLTRHEQRLYAYYHINLSTKEIAALLNITPASVRQAKARLNKKMNLVSGE
jgi:DNA-binding transcriptional MerR regulator